MQYIYSRLFYKWWTKFIIDEQYCIFPLPYSPPSSHFNPFVCVHVSCLLFRPLSVSSVQFNCSLVSKSLQPHGLQHARPPCPSPTPGVYSNSCPLSWWCLPTILSSVVPFSSCLQSFPVPGSFLRTQLFESGGQNIGVSASTSVFPMNIQDWFPLGWTDLMSCCPRDSLEPSPTPQFKTSVLPLSVFFMIQLSHPYMTTGKTTALTINMDFCR